MTTPRMALPPIESRLTGTAHPRNQLKRRLKSELARLTVQDGHTLHPSLWLSVTAAPFVLHVAVREDTTLADVDAFLRGVWMECCGHLSQFEARTKNNRPVTYLADPEESEDDEEFDVRDALFPDMSDEEWVAINARLRNHHAIEKPLTVTVRVAMTGVPDLRYEYDMGSTTRCTLKVEAELTLPWPDGRTVRLLARNARPDWVCRECGEAATQLCTMGECWDGGYATFCEAHARPHSRKAHPREGGDSWMMARLSNSPRDPSCGYEERPASEKEYVW